MVIKPIGPRKEWPTETRNWAQEKIIAKLKALNVNTEELKHNSIVLPK